jgi:hypothetical protein
MSESSEIPAWKEELDAIVGARAHGQALDAISIRTTMSA